MIDIYRRAFKYHSDTVHICHHAIFLNNIFLILANIFSAPSWSKCCFSFQYNLSIVGKSYPNAELMLIFYQLEGINNQKFKQIFAELSAHYSLNI